MTIHAVGDAVVNFLEEDGDGRLWGPLCGHHIFDGLKHLGYDYSVPIVEVGYYVERGDL